MATPEAILLELQSNHGMKIRDEIQATRADMTGRIIILRRTVGFLTTTWVSFFFVVAPLAADGDLERRFRGAMIKKYAIVSVFLRE